MDQVNRTAVGPSCVSMNQSPCSAVEVVGVVDVVVEDELDAHAELQGRGLSLYLNFYGVV